MTEMNWVHNPDADAKVDEMVEKWDEASCDCGKTGHMSDEGVMNVETGEFVCDGCLKNE